MIRLSMEWLTARCAVIGFEDGGYYHTVQIYSIWLNGSEMGVTNRAITPLYGLMPETEYHLRVLGEDGKSESMDFTTPYEYVTLNVRDFGAKGDGLENDTAAIQAAIFSCPGESRVLVPPGSYRVSHLFLKSELRLELAKGAMLLGIPSREGLPVLPGMVESTDEQQEYNLGTWEGNPLSMFVSLLTGIHVKNVAIYGEGVLDGGATEENWWKDVKHMQGAWRPRMVFLNRCEEITLSGLMVKNSPSWHIHPYFSKRVRLLGLQILSPSDSPNTDGINPESCSNITLKGIRFSVGDDCVALKSGKKYMGDLYATPCEHVRISHCEMGDGHGAVTLGSEMSGGIFDVIVEDCDFYDTDRGLRVKTRRGRGKNAIIDQIIFRRIRMQNVKTPFTINCFYSCDPDGQAKNVQDRRRRALKESTPEIKTLVFEEIHCEDCHVAAAWFLGLPERPIESITMRNVEASFSKNARQDIPIMTVGAKPCVRKGIIAENVRDLQLINVNIQGAIKT